MDWQEMYDLLYDVVGVSKEALDLAFGINGCSKETAEKILYYYTGWQGFTGWLNDLEGKEWQ